MIHAVWRKSLTAERNAAALYQALATADPQAPAAQLYTKLADTERRHAAHWEQRLRDAGAKVPAVRLNWRTHVLGWLARRWGPALVLPTLADIERDAGSEYAGDPDKTVQGMARDERGHARMFRALAENTQITGGDVAKLEGRHKAGGNALRAAVLGANDGLLSNFSLIMGVAGAQMAGGTIVVTGLAGLVAGACSMALGEWLSVQSARELYTHQIKIEADELAEAPEEEMEELALIYQAKGLSVDEARKLAERLLSDKDNALDTLAREELGIDPEELGGSAWEAAGTSFLLFALGAIIPLLPFFFTSGIPGVIWSAAASAVGLFTIGAAITLMTGRSALWSGLRQVLIGLAAAAVTYLLGHLVGGHIG
ncbi:MAG: VIT1/CCC1 transporter family protein [Kiritimatiellaeota bacterium]|nr:VIT1/CCC1 transporter family protein [Kiritimatiellota bacterium]